MLSAKSDEVYVSVRENFEQVMQKKVYQAKCMGEFKINEGHMEHFLTPSDKRGHKMKCGREYTPGSQQANLTYRVLSFDQKANVSEVLIFLETGLRHQIRAQLSHEGHPHLGDVLYAGPESNRLYLHALEYEVKFKNTQKHFKASLPSDW